MMKPTIMSPERVLTLLNGNRLDELKAYANEVLAEECAHSRSGDELSRRRAVLRYIKQTAKSIRPQNAGAWVIDGTQFLCNGRSAFAFDEGHHIPNLPVPEADANGLVDVSVYLHKRPVPDNTHTITQSELKLVTAGWRADGKPGSRCFYKIGPDMHDATQLLEAMQILGADTITLEQPSNPLAFCYFSVEGRKAMIGPWKPTGNEPYREKKE